MANKFEILISAVDKASKTISGVGSAMDRIGKAQKKLGAAQGKGADQSVKDSEKAGKALSEQAEKARKLEEAANGVKTAQFGMFSAAAKFLLPGSAIWLAGKMAEEWAQSGQEIGRTSASIGVSTGRLQQFRGAAQLAGLSSEDMTGSLKALGETMQGAEFGRNPQALAMMNMLGVSIKRTKDGTVDTTAAMFDLSRVISKIADPNVQRVVASSFGLESILPLLREGPVALEAYMRKMDEFGMRSKEQIKNAEKTAQAFAGLKLAISGVWNDTQDKLVSSGAIDRLTAYYQGKFRPMALDTSDTTQARKDESTANRTSSGKINGPAFVQGQAEKPAAGTGSPPPDPDAPRNVRNNNPGNIEAGKFADRHGATGSDGRFARFQTADAGIGAAASLMTSYGNQGINTVSGIVGKWAPKSENANFDSDVAGMSKKTGFAPNQQLDMRDPKILQSLLSARFKNEGGNPYTTEQLASAIAAALAQNQQPIQVNVAGLPTGATATARAGSAMSTPTKVAYSMPTTLTP